MMKMKAISTVLSIAFLSVFALGGSMVSYASTTTPPSPDGVSPQVAVDVPGWKAPFWLHHDGKKDIIYLPEATRLKLYCWYDKSGARSFYAQIIDGRYEGGEGDIWAHNVAFQTKVPHC